MASLEIMNQKKSLNHCLSDFVTVMTRLRQGGDLSKVTVSQWLNWELNADLSNDKVCAGKRGDISLTET